MKDRNGKDIVSPLDTLQAMTEQHMLNVSTQVVEFVKKHTSDRSTARHILEIASIVFGGGFASTSARLSRRAAGPLPLEEPSTPEGLGSADQ